jgi:hypothetical protein
MFRQPPLFLHFRLLDVFFAYRWCVLAGIPHDEEKS